MQPLHPIPALARVVGDCSDLLGWLSTNVNPSRLPLLSHVQVGELATQPWKLVIVGALDVEKCRGARIAPGCNALARHGHERPPWASPKTRSHDFS